MTPKEKAEDLITKFSGNTVHYDCTKQCALIAVDEIIENDKKNYGIDGFVVEYWQEVKQEIEKL